MTYCRLTMTSRLCSFSKTIIISLSLLGILNEIKWNLQNSKIISSNNNKVFAGLVLVSAQTCEIDADDMYTSYDHLALWTNFMGETVVEKCEDGVSTNICTKNDINDFQWSFTKTFFDDMRGLRDTSEYNDLLEACQSESNYIPVEVDMELLFENNNTDDDDDDNSAFDLRFWYIKRLYCFPGACSTVEQYEEAFYAIMGEDWRSAVLRLDFHPLEEPGSTGSDEDCDPSDAAWTNLPFSLKLAHSSYVTRYNEECVTTTDRASYCNTVYYSGGEFDSTIVNFYENDSSSDYEAFEEDCFDRDGEICTIDFTITKQLHVGEIFELDPDDVKVDINFFYHGLPQCFPKSCNYDEKIDEAIEVEIPKGFTWRRRNLDQRHNKNFDMLSSSSHNIRGGDTTHSTSTISIPESIKEHNTKNIGTKKASRQLEDKKEAYNNSSSDEEEIDDPQVNLEVERDILLEISKSVDPETSPYVTKEYPYEMFDDDRHGGPKTAHNNGAERRMTFKSYEGFEDCGTGFHQCFTKLSNVCLRRIGTGSIF